MMAKKKIVEEYWVSVGVYKMDVLVIVGDVDE